MPLPHKKTKITKALGRAAKAGVRRVVAPTKQELAREEATRIDRQQAKARAGLRKPKKPKKPKKTSAQMRQERATRAIGLGGLLDALQSKKKGKK